MENFYFKQNFPDFYVAKFQTKKRLRSRDLAHSGHAPDKGSLRLGRKAKKDRPFKDNVACKADRRCGGEAPVAERILHF